MTSPSAAPENSITVPAIESAHVANSSKNPLHLPPSLAKDDSLAWCKSIVNNITGGLLVDKFNILYL